MQIVGCIAAFFSLYNFIYGCVKERIGDKEESISLMLEAAVWSVAAVICFK